MEVISANTIEDKEEKPLSPREKRFIKKVIADPSLIEEKKLEIIADYLNKSIEYIAEIIASLGMSLVPTQFSVAKLHILAKKQRYIISSAQNASPVNAKFLLNIEAYAKFIDAEIGIIATRYKNPTSIWKEEGDAWDETVHKYLIANEQSLHKDVIVLADLKIQATAPNPTSGIDSHGDQASLIVGAPKIEMRSVPVLPTQKQKFIYSTGSVTDPNFTDTVAGGKAVVHHSYGFVVVEIDEEEDIVHLRSVAANDEGEFNDLIYRVQDGTVTIEGVETLVWGDSHFAKKRGVVTSAFRKLCADLEITKSVLHDIWDSESLNVHNYNRPTVRYRLFKEGKDSLQKELDQMYEELNWFEEFMEETIVVSSNHDDMIDRSLDIPNLWALNLTNAELILKMLQMKLSGVAEEGVVATLINTRYENILALGLNDSYISHDVELALHGHKGANGSRGSAKAFSKLSCKTIIGHTHSPSIMGGCYQVGISCSLEHGYNFGLSGWAYAGVTLNKHGKRQMIVFHKDTLTYTTLY
ncbi:MAG: hypothetical protein ACOH2V_00950 [Candidatus Saccharimonadaceae bacterium]